MGGELSIAFLFLALARILCAIDAIGAPAVGCTPGGIGGVTAGVVVVVKFSGVVVWTHRAQLCVVVATVSNGCGAQWKHY